MAQVVIDKTKKREFFLTQNPNAYLTLCVLMSCSKAYMITLKLMTTALGKVDND